MYLTTLSIFSNVMQYDTSLKVAGSIPDGVIGFFN
jgi:hypothetical protein